MSEFRNQWRKALSAKNAKQRTQKGKYRKRDPFRAMTHVVRRPERKSREDASAEGEAVVADDPDS